MCILDWDIPKPFIVQLNRYYLRHLPTKQFLAFNCYASIIDPTVQDSEVQYSTSYHNCNIDELKKYSEILISYRRIKGWDRGYALIRPKLGTLKT
jgi:hypothetical protein